MLLADLTTPMTSDEVRTSIYNVLSLVGVNTTTWKPGAVVRTMISASSIVIAACTTLIAQVAQGGFLAESSGDWRTLKAFYDYGVLRDDATFATGVVTLVNTGGGVFNVDPEALILLNPTTGKTYRNTAAIALGAFGTLTNVPIRASDTGAASTAPANTITAFVTPLLGVTVTNPAALVGTDAQGDASLLTECNESLGALSPNGPKDAYAYFARRALLPDGNAINVNRVRTQTDEFGTVTVYVAKASGALSGTELTAVDTAIQTNVAPLAITALVLNATPKDLAITYEVWAYNTSGLTDAQLTSKIATALTTFVSTQPIGGNVVGADPGKVFVSALSSTIFAADPSVFRVAITVPAADFVLQPSEVPVITSITVTAVHQQAPGTL